MTAANRRRMMWFDMSRQSAGGRAARACIGHASPATADEPEAFRADPDLSALGLTETKTAGAGDPRPIGGQAGGGQLNGHPSAKNPTN